MMIAMATQQTASRPPWKRTLTERTRPTPAVAAAVTMTVAAGLLAVAVTSSWNPFRSLDQGAADHLHAYALAHPTWTRAMTDVSGIGTPNTFRAVVAALAIALWFRGRRSLALCAVGAMAVGAVVDTGVKDWVGRARPTFAQPVAYVPGPGYPSGHTLSAVVGCGVIVLVLLATRPSGFERPWIPWTVAAIVAGTIGFSRIALGVHWVTDVVGGCLLAGAILAATAALLRQKDSDEGPVAE